MDLQKLLDALVEQDRLTRSRYHVTLGEIVKALDEAPNRDAHVALDSGRYTEGCGPHHPHSYRGYYSDLAFEPDGFQPKVRDFHSDCIGVLDRVLTGYKGGDFKMTADTPVWIAMRGESSGLAVVGLDVSDDEFRLLTKEIE